MKVLLVDDHPLFLEGLQNLCRARNIQVVGIARDGLEAIAIAPKVNPDVVLMDIQMPQCNGLEATRQIKTLLPKTQIVMLTTSADDDDLFEAIKGGASGYLLKSLDVDHFFDLISGLTRGEAALTRDLATRIMAEFARQGQRDQPINLVPLPSDPALGEAPDTLTERQTEVLRLIVQGRTNAEIAEMLCITDRTVKYHIHEILQKLHLRNRAQMAAYGALNGLIADA